MRSGRHVECLAVLLGPRLFPYPPWRGRVTGAHSRSRSKRRFIALGTISPTHGGELYTSQGTGQVGRLFVQCSWAAASVHAVPSGSSVIQVSASLLASIR